MAITIRGQIYDYMNVNSIHNATFADTLPDTFLAQARALANWHEYNVFTDTGTSGIGNSKSMLTPPLTTQAWVERTHLL